MSKQKLRDGDIVTNPDWNDGKQVRVTVLGEHAIRYQDAGLRSRAVHVRLDDDTKTKRGGGR